MIRLFKCFSPLIFPVFFSDGMHDTICSGFIHRIEWIIIHADYSCTTDRRFTIIISSVSSRSPSPRSFRPSHLAYAHFIRYLLDSTYPTAGHWDLQPSQSAAVLLTAEPTVVHRVGSGHGMSGRQTVAKPCGHADRSACSKSDDGCVNYDHRRCGYDASCCGCAKKKLLKYVPGDSQLINQLINQSINWSRNQSQSCKSIKWTSLQARGPRSF